MSKIIINGQLVKGYSRKSNILPALAILLEWGIILSAFYLCIYFNLWYLYVLGIVLIATRMLALQSLAHEACHYNLNKNKKVNEWMAHLFVVWPIFLNLGKMRKVHLTHHRHLQTDKDPEIKHLEYPEFQFPMTLSKFLQIALKDITGWNFIKYRWKKLPYIILMYDKTASQRIYYISILLCLFYFQLLLPFFILWIIPYMTLYQLLNRVRLYYEHFNMQEDKNTALRSVHLSRVKAFFLAP
ncbi:MAG: fatty acid desaturase, partial [Chitinophagales bacterium]|nr:fatty acid desaturase [Chitinophagales bacterium]